MIKLKDDVMKFVFFCVVFVILVIVVFVQDLLCEEICCVLVSGFEIMEVIVSKLIVVSGVMILMYSYSGDEYVVVIIVVMV